MSASPWLLNPLGEPDRRARRSEQRVAPLRGLVVALVLAAATAGHAQSIEDALALHLSGELDRALEAYAQVVAATEASAPNVAAAAYTNSCAIWMSRSEYELALAACEHALRLRRVTQDLPRTARTLNNLGLTLQNLGRYGEARERYLEAIDINRSAGEWESVAQNLLNLSGVEIQAGDYGRALQRVGEVLELSDEHPEADWRSTQRRIAFLNQGVALEKLGAYRAALESYQQALDEDESADEALEALLTVDLGVIYRNLGDPVRAVELFERAATVYRRLDNASGLSNALLNLALARHLNLERPESAEHAYREALQLAEAAGDLPEEIQDLFYLATLLLEQNRLAEAEELFSRALSHAEGSGSAEGRWSALYGLGRVAVASGERGRASDYFDRALQIIEGVRARLTPSSHRGAFFGDRRPVFEAAIHNAAVAPVDRTPGATIETAERAFELVQRAKARELLEALGESRAARPLGAGEIAARLADDELLLEFFVAEGELLRWRLERRREPKLESLGDSTELLAAILRLHRSLAGSGAPSAGDLERLSAGLLDGLGPLAGRRLIVAPDGGLRYLPFELLPSPGDGGEPLIELATVTYLPSGSTLTSSAGGPGHPALSFVALANPRLPTAGAGPRPAALLAARFGLRDLPAAEREVASIERWLGGPARVLIGDRASEAAFRDAAATGSRVVHLAAHTVIDERPGRSAAVLLTPEGEDDGLLQPQEIAALELHTDLAVLAGCRTALADQASGDSIASLTGAFLAAGARGVVATLWEVGDDATAAFMDQFYWQLGRGATPAEALRSAKLRFREQADWRAPHLWAGYVLIGQSPAIAAGRIPWGWIAVAVLALSIVALLMQRRRRRAVY